MGTSTSRLSLYKPAISGEDADIADINGNMDILDSYVGLHQCTSGTRPSSPWRGLLIEETDTGKIYRYNGSAWKLFAYETDPAKTGYTFESNFADSGSGGACDFWTWFEKDYLYLRGVINPTSGDFSTGTTKFATLDSDRRPTAGAPLYKPVVRWVNGASPADRTADAVLIIASDGSLSAEIYTGATTGIEIDDIPIRLV